MPVLFLDINDELQSDDVSTGSGGGQLFGEKPETMVELPIIRHEEKQVRVCVSAECPSCCDCVCVCVCGR